MSVTIKRSVGSLSVMSNVSVILNEVVLEKLAPGESVTFELPNKQESIKISTAVTSKEFVVEDGQTFDIVRDNRMWIMRYLFCIVFIIITFIPFFNNAYITRSNLIIQLIFLLGLAIFDWFIPKYLVKESSSLSEKEKNWNSY